MAIYQFVGNKARRISKQVFPENKAHQIFRKTIISYPLMRKRTCTYQGVRNVHFSENLAFCFLETPVEICPFVLLTMNYAIYHFTVPNPSKLAVLQTSICVRNIYYTEKGE